MKKTLPPKLQSQLELLGSALQNIRVQHGQGQKDVASDIGFSTNTIINIENGTGCSLSTLLVLLEHYGIADDLVETIQSHVDRSKPTPGRFVKQKAKPKPVFTPSVDASSLVVSAEELCPGEEPISLTDAVRDQDVLGLIESFPNNVYRINRNHAMKLARDESNLNLAIYSHSVLYKPEGGEPRQREVYYVTSVDGAAKHKLNWTVGGLNRNPHKSVDAIVSVDDVDDSLLPIVNERRDELLVLLRHTFAKHGIFVDHVIMGQSGRTKEHYLRKSNRPVKGETYQSLYRTQLNEWIATLGA